MKYDPRIILTLILAILCAPLCSAAPEAVPTKIKLGELRPMKNALALIDQGETEVIIEGGEVKERKVIRPFRLSIAIRLAVALNFAAVNEQTTTLDALIKTVQAEVWGTEKVDETADTPTGKKWREKLEKMSETEIEVPLVKMSRTELLTNSDDPKGKPNQVPAVPCLQPLAKILTP